MSEVIAIARMRVTACLGVLAIVGSREGMDAIERILPPPLLRRCRSRYWDWWGWMRRCE